MAVVRKILRITGWSFLFLFIALNLWILISGRTYLYKGIWNTYLKGRSGPAVDEYAIFDNNTVLAGTPQPWPVAKDYNKKTIPPALLSKMQEIQTGAFLVIKNDSVRSEYYWDGFSDSSKTNSFSMAKSIVSVLVGCAIQDGFIKNVNQPVSDFLPELKNASEKGLTIRDLLMMSSGINFDEDYVNPLAYPAQAYYGSDLRSLTMKYEVTGEPGKEFKYLSGNTQLLGFILKRVTHQSLSEYATEKLWKPLGAEHPALWSLDREGGDEKSFCCFNSSARDFARIGQLYLDTGKWKGRQLVPQDYVLASTHPTGMTENGKPCTNYGYSWWLIPSYQGHDVFYMRGILGQYVLVIPDLNMIVVRLGRKRLPNDSNDLPLDARFYLDAALQMYGQ